jgi:hypothetical protein
MRFANLLDSILGTLWKTLRDLLAAPFSWLFRKDPETDPARAAAAATEGATVRAEKGSEAEEQVTAAAKATRALARILSNGGTATEDELAAVPRMARTWLENLSPEQRQIVGGATVAQLRRALGGGHLEGVPSILRTLAKVDAAPEPDGLAARLATLRAKRTHDRESAPLVPVMA